MEEGKFSAEKYEVASKKCDGTCEHVISDNFSQPNGTYKAEN